MIPLPMIAEERLIFVHDLGEYITSWWGKEEGSIMVSGSQFGGSGNSEQEVDWKKHHLILCLSNLFSLSAPHFLWVL